MGEKVQISSRQFTALIFTTILSVSSFRIPSLLLPRARQDFWAAVVMAAVVELAVGTMLFWLGRNHPGKTIFAYAEEILGRAWGKVAAVAYVLLFIQAAALEARNFAELLAAVMAGVPLLVFVFLLVLVAGMAVNYGLEVIARSAELAGAITFFFSLAVTVLVAEKADWGNLLPLGQAPPQEILGAGLLLAAFFGVCVMMGVFMAQIEHPQIALRAKAAAVGAASLIVLAGYAVDLGLFGPLLTTAPSLQHVDYQVTRLISIRGFFERVEASSLVFWFVGASLAVSALYYCACAGATQVLGLKSHRLCILPVGAAIVILAVRQFPNTAAFDSYVSTAFVKGALGIEVGLTGILLAIDRLRQRRR